MHHDVGEDMDGGMSDLSNIVHRNHLQFVENLHQQGFLIALIVLDNEIADMPHHVADLEVNVLFT
jgi:hypothetical protein